MSVIRLVSAKVVNQAFRLETEGYPQDEAASYNQLRIRQKEAPNLFLGLFEGSTLIGFICATRYHGPRFKEEAMQYHIPDAACVCIHSVCVSQARRRQGIALKLLEAFNEHVRTTEQGAVKTMLICKAVLIPLYTRAGFTFVCKSSIVHGRNTWHEMEKFI